MTSPIRKNVEKSLQNKGILDTFIRALGPLLFSPKKDEVIEGIARIAGEGAEAAPRSGLQRQMAETGSYGAGVRDLGTQTAPPSPLPPSVQRLIPQPPGYLDNPIRSGVVTDSVDRVEPAVRSVREMMENPANVAFPRSFGAQQGPTMPGISSPLFEGAFPIGADTNQLRLSFQYPAGTVIDGKKVGGRVYRDIADTPENRAIIEALNKQRVGDVEDFPEAMIYRQDPNQRGLDLDPEGTRRMVGSPERMNAPSIPVRTAGSMGNLGTNVVDLSDVTSVIAAMGAAGLGINYLQQAAQEGAQPGSDLTVPARNQAAPLSPGGGVSTGMSNIPVKEQYVNNPNFGKPGDLSDFVRDEPQRPVLDAQERGVMNRGKEEALYAAQQSGDPALAAAARIMQELPPEKLKSAAQMYEEERALVEALTTGQMQVIADLLRETPMTPGGDNALPRSDEFVQANPVLAYRAAQQMPGFEERMSMQTGDTVTVPKATTEMGSDTSANMQGAAEAAGAIVETSMLPDAFRPAAMQGNYDLATATQPRVQGQLKTPQQLLQEQLLGTIG